MPVLDGAGFMRECRANPEYGDVPILDRRSSGAIDELDMFEDDFERADAQELAHFRREIIDTLGTGNAGVRQSRQHEPVPHSHRAWRDR